MITAEYCRTMARYNAWQNKGIRGLVEEMPDPEVRKDREAFFGSIFGTLNHLLLGDMLWMARFDGGLGPEVGLAQSTEMTPTRAEWAAARFRLDGRIILWAEQLKTVDLVGDLTWQSTAQDREMTRPKAVCMTHFFNHQTHHRGQIHAMFTAAGVTPGDTDLVFMPD